MSLDLRALYEHESDAVVSLLGRFGLRGADLEDAVHDTFITALSRASSYDAKRPARPWLLGIAFRMGVARVRRAPLHAAVAEPPDQADPTANPERALEQRQTQALVRRAIAELSEEQGAVFVMYDLEGVPAGEIAEAMGTPVATTYSRLRLARQNFAVAMRRLQEEEGGRS